MQAHLTSIPKMEPRLRPTTLSFVAIAGIWLLLYWRLLQIMKTTGEDGNETYHQLPTRANSSLERNDERSWASRFLIGVACATLVVRSKSGGKQIIFRYLKYASLVLLLSGAVLFFFKLGLLLGDITESHLMREDQNTAIGFHVLPSNTFGIFLIPAHLHRGKCTYHFLCQT